MAKKKHISAVISLKDNFSAGLRGIKREQKSFQKEVRQTRLAMDSLNKKKTRIKLDTTAAHKAIQKFRKDERYLEAKKKIVKAIVLKDQATDKIKKVKSSLKSVGKTVAKPVIQAKDKATSIIKGLGSKLAILTKGVTIPLAVAGAGVGMALKGGAELEQQQISMRHFMGVGNEGKSAKELDKMSAQYLKELRKNANATPFETGEVIAAGTRALQIAGGSTSEAMKKVKLAEDMAALNPGKTIGDAMEALADMEMGEYARLTEFGVKATKENGDTPQSVQAELQKMYEGGAGKLSTSATGLLSTITGKLKSNLADMGQSMLEPLKPVMTDVVGFIDSITPKMLEFGTKIGEGLGAGVSWINENMPSIKATLEPILNFVGTAFTTAFTVAGNIVSTVAPFIKQLLDDMKPVFDKLSEVLPQVGEAFTNCFKAAMNIVEKAYDFLKPKLDWLGDKISGFMDGVGSVASTVGGWFGIGKNATGTKYWRGGLSLVGEHGPELVQMPSGSKVYTNRETNSMMNQSLKTRQSSEVTNNTYSININIDGLHVREEADLDKIANALVKKINQNRIILG